MKSNSKVAPMVIDGTKAQRIDRTDPILTFVLKHSDALVNIAGRWVDECEYEDIADYAAVIRKLLPRNWRFVEVHTGGIFPLGFDFVICGKQPIYRLSIFVDAIEKDRIVVEHKATNYALHYYPKGE